jgi:hypothetical protein
VTMATTPRIACSRRFDRATLSDIEIIVFTSATDPSCQVIAMVLRFRTSTGRSATCDLQHGASLARAAGGCTEPRSLAT